MKLQNYLGRIQLIVVCLMAFLAGTLLGAMLIKFFWPTLTFDSNILSLIGGIIGGILSGIIAYIVAAFQVKKTRETESQKLYYQICSSLELIHIELSLNYDLIEKRKLSYIEDDDRVFLPHIQTDIWERSSIQLGREIDSDVMKKIMRTYRFLRHFKMDIEELDSHRYDNLLQDIISSKITIHAEIKRISNL